MELLDPSFRCFIALITFERESDECEILQPDDQGACGWMGAQAASEDQLAGVFAAELSELGLRLKGIDNIIEVSSVDEVASYDQHLASNMAAWQAGKRTVWGTIHTYLADGES